MPKRDFSEIAKEKQAQRVEERPSVEQINTPPSSRVVMSVPPSSPTTRQSYGQYSTIVTKYAKGEMPRRHADLYQEICRALGGKQAGEVNMGTLLENIEMNRASAAQILGHLENFGFLRHERRPRGTFIEILK